MLQAGDRIEWRPGSSQFEKGMRTGTVVALVTYREAMQREAARQGEPWPIFADRNARGLSLYGEVPYPWVRLDADPVRGVPEGVEVAALWGEFTVLPDPEPVPA